MRNLPIFCSVTYHAVCLDAQMFGRLVACTEPASRAERRGSTRLTKRFPIPITISALRPGGCRRWSGSWPTGSPATPKPSPRAVLVAGCGTGAEAFAFSRRFPHAEIVAVDFSRRAIRFARQYQQRAQYRKNVRFVVADFSAPGLDRLTGRDFDLVSCHGVLSYVPRAARALKNLSGCLSPDGALGLGVNGAQHVSVGLRARNLPMFGFDVSQFTEGPHVRRCCRCSTRFWATPALTTAWRHGPPTMCRQMCSVS